MKGGGRPGAPIGVFDSGVGGLTVVRALARRLPGEDLVYLGDTARTPYGSKARETVTRFAVEGADYLRRHGIKALVVACNTASAYALPALRRRLDLPVFGVIAPGARAALAFGFQGPVGVIGTQATISSGAYLRAMRRRAPRVAVLSRACPLFVPLVEEGWLDQDVTRRVAEVYLRPLLRRRIRSLVLGCTHYPALKPLLQRLCGPEVRLIDSAEEVAREVQSSLGRLELLRPQGRRGRRVFYVTDVAEPFRRVGRHLLGATLSSVRRISLPEAPRRVRTGR